MDKWLSNALRTLTVESSYSDCQIIIGNKTFDCHKIVLGSASEFFERMFLGSFKEAEMPVITLNDVKNETFEKFRLYAYTYAKTDLEQYDNNALTDLLEIGNKWLVKSLATDCVEIQVQRCESMIIDDLLKLYQCAYNIINNTLIETISQVLKNKHKEHLNCLKALELSSDVFEQYLKMCKGHLTEIQRFEMIQDYVDINELCKKGDADTQNCNNKNECHTEKETNEETDRKNENEDGDAISIDQTDQTDIKDDADTQNCNNKNGCNTDEETIENDSANFEETDKENENEEGEAISINQNNQTDNEDELAEANLKKKKLELTYVNNLLSLINYKEMTKHEFYKGPGKSSLLSCCEKYEFLYLTN